MANDSPTNRSGWIFSGPSCSALACSSFLFSSAPREEKKENVCRYKQDLEVLVAGLEAVIRLPKEATAT